MSSPNQPNQEVQGQEVKLRDLKWVSLADVKLSNGPRIVHYRQEGYYIITIKPSYAIEVEIQRGERIQRRYYVVGRVFTLEPVTEIDAALEALEKVQTETEKIRAEELQLIMIPRRVMRKIVEATRKHPQKSYTLIIQAQGQGRDRTYSLVKIVEAAFVVEDPDDETIAELEEALKNVIAKIGSKKNGGESE